ncbi:hypothetical protein THOD03_20219 [Vibrio harveyi]|nr:hypothetical protein TH15OA1_530176 [Vibrio harveyi]CAH1555956.1 hypothetical protein THOD03_20219 [Vibrio harveyi]
MATSCRHVVGTSWHGDQSIAKVLYALTLLVLELQEKRSAVEPEVYD